MCIYFVCASYTESGELQVFGYKYQRIPAILFIVTRTKLMVVCVVVRTQKNMHGFSQDLREILRISQDFRKLV